MNNNGFVMFISVNDLFKDFARDYPSLLQDAEILVISRDIIGNGEIEDEGEIPFSNQAKSRYENINFIPQLVPNASVMEYSYGSTRAEFYESYMQQLNTKDATRLLCCIADLVTHDKSKIFLVCSQTDYLLEYMEVMRDYLETRFRLKIYSYVDFQQDNDCIYNIGDVDEIKQCLKAQLMEHDLIDDVTETFFNEITDNIVEIYRKTLMQKSVDELDKLAMKRGIYVNRHKPKEQIVESIIRGLVKDRGYE